MNIKRRLIRLECKPFLRPLARRNGEWLLPVDECAAMRCLQKKLALPLPIESTPTERAHALELFKAGRDRIRLDFGDTGGCDAVRDYALGLHTKYGTDPTWGD